MLVAPSTNSPEGTKLSHKYTRRDSLATKLPTYSNTAELI